MTEASAPPMMRAEGLIGCLPEVSKMQLFTPRERIAQTKGGIQEYPSSS